MRIIANWAISIKAKVTSGTPQGAGCSPLFFAIFFNILAYHIDMLEKEEDGIEEETHCREEAVQKGKRSKVGVI